MARSSLWRKILAVPVVAFLAFAGVAATTGPALAAPIEPGFAVLTPQPGETVLSRTVTFGGTGIDGSTVVVLDANDQPLPGTTPAVVTEGLWLSAVEYPDTAELAQTVFIAQVTGGVQGEPTRLEFLLPAGPILPAPVITSPTEGATITGTAVTFEGTGSPGAYIGIVVVPTALVQGAADQALSAAAAPVPANPADPIPVGSNGAWQVTVALPPENYTAVAIQSTDAAATTGISDPSLPVAFSLVAAAVTPVVDPVANGTSTPPRALAVTGPADSAGALGLGALIAMSGLAMVVFARRRTSNQLPTLQP